MNRLFCFGLGFSAHALAARLKTKGWRVAGTTRTAERAQALSEQGYEVFTFAPGHPLSDPIAALRDTTHVLISIPPGAPGDPVLANHVHDLSALVPSPRWLGYLSTTGVYGDHAGGWVSEDTPVAPVSERAKRRVGAEQAWTAFAAAQNLSLHIFRLAGIYGPGRNQLETVRDGTARRIVKPGQVFSRIHVEDVAAVLEAAIANPWPGIYNVCDDEPAPPHEVVEYAAQLLGLPPPPLEQFDEASRTMSEMVQSFYADSKRVKNDRIKTDLGVTLRYPTYREGLKALLSK